MPRREALKERKSPLGTRRFQRAVVWKDALIEIKRPEAASGASSDYRLQSCASGHKRVVVLQCVFPHDCTLEAMRTQAIGTPTY